jgi:Cof subfamily protein (haloacid dehalogenase superfamily)
MGKFTGVLIATDLDGTLLNSKKYVDEESQKAISRFMDEGGYFTFATGRLYQSFQNIRKRVSQNAPIVFANGSQIYDMEKEKLLWECGLDADIEPLCNEILESFPGTAGEVYRHKKCDTVRENDITRKHMADFEIERTEHSSFSGIEKPWTKVLFTNDTETLKKISDYITSRYKKANAKFSSKALLEVFSADTDKGRGVKKLADMLGVSYNDIYAAGDQENDLDLLSAADISFAPENAVPAVKRIVDVVLPDNDRNTIAALISYLEKHY